MQDQGEEQKKDTLFEAESTPIEGSDPYAEILVGDGSGKKKKMTVAEADAQVAENLEKAKANAPEGATVRVVQEGETTRVVTEVPGDNKPTA